MMSCRTCNGLPNASWQALLQKDMTARDSAVAVTFCNPPQFFFDCRHRQGIWPPNFCCWQSPLTGATATTGSPNTRQPKCGMAPGSDAHGSEGCGEKRCAKLKDCLVYLAGRVGPKGPAQPPARHGHTRAAAAAGAARRRCPPAGACSRAGSSKVDDLGVFTVVGRCRRSRPIHPRNRCSNR